MDEEELVHSKLICACVKENEKFLLQNEVGKRAFDLAFELLEYCQSLVLFSKAIDIRSSAWSMLFFVINPKICSMICALLLGDIPTCYMCMRAILEGAVDAVIIGVGRFLEEEFPKDLERLKELEKKKNISFSEKCDLLLPSWVDKKTKDKCKKLWKDLSGYWLHSSGTLEMIRKRFEEAAKDDRKGLPSWTFGPPHRYFEWYPEDKKDLGKLASNLQELLSVLKVLFKPFEPKDL